MAAAGPKAKPATKPAPVANWLGHLVERRRAQNFVEPTPQMLVEAAAARRAEADAAVFDVIAARIDPAVVDPPVIRAFLDRVGPWDPVRVAELVDLLLLDHPRDTHVQGPPGQPSHPPQGVHIMSATTRCSIPGPSETCSTG